MIEIISTYSLISINQYGINIVRTFFSAVYFRVYLINQAKLD